MSTSFAPLFPGMLLDAASRFAQDAAASTGPALASAIGDMGWAGTLVPEDLGGVGGTLADLAATAGGLAAHGVHLPLVEVWKDPNCGCCKDWVKHLEVNGFRVKVYDEGNTAARKRLGLPDKLGSCHTAKVAHYVVEGHVPAADIQRLLRERPQAIGLAGPGMPVGSPRMGGPEYGGRKDRYDVLLVAANGTTRVYQRYNGWTFHLSKETP